MSILTDDLPALTGSEKQVAWANLIRPATLARFHEIAAKLTGIVNEDDISEAMRRETVTGIAIIKAEMLSESSAKWWIDSRYGYRESNDILDIMQRRGMLPVLDAMDAAARA